MKYWRCMIMEGLNSKGKDFPIRCVWLWVNFTASMPMGNTHVDNWREKVKGNWLPTLEKAFHASIVLSALFGCNQFRQQFSSHFSLSLVMAKKEPPGIFFMYIDKFLCLIMCISYTLGVINTHKNLNNIYI